MGCAPAPQSTHACRGGRRTVAAREAGATKARIRKSTGLKSPQVTAALAAATPSGETRASVEALPRELTLEDLAILAEFEGDHEAVDQLLNAARWHGTLDHQAERLRQERADKAEHERLCHELEDAERVAAENGSA